MAVFAVATAFGLIAIGCADPERDRSADNVATSTSVSSTGPLSTVGTTAAPTTRATPASTATTTTTTTTSTPTPSSTTTSTSTTTTSTLPPPPSTACTSVAHISDSTGVYLWEAQYVRDEANTMGSRYRSIGVDEIIHDESGGRSIVERVADWQTNALEVAEALRRDGFDGCWVVMIGTNDAANVAAGSSIGFEQRILRMLYAFGDAPVLWVDASTNRDYSAYRADSMRAWNDELYRIAAERPNVAVVRWSEIVRPEWFVDDGIHMTVEGRIWRAATVAGALAEHVPG